ncbi:MAG: pyruvate kinase, partial [Flavobacteriia bacterium]|nr:pyruvate kinase [Flavobacteriia bacterium]
MNTIKKTKIVATLGPATASAEVIEKMILAGVNVFRVNFSHADYQDVSKRIQMIRQVDQKLNTNTAILGDLQGPKLRVGEMEEGVEVKPGDRVLFSTEAPFVGNAQKAYMNYKNFPKDVAKGERILLDDGKLIFEVTQTNKKNEVEAVVIQGGPFKSKKGVNLPNTKISLPALTKKDIEDAKFIFTQDIDWIALSFVRYSQDLIALKELMEAHCDRKIPIISKIEKPEAIENIDKIIAYSDGLMVARGDLGVEVPAQEVPLIQKKLVLLAKNARIPI